MKKKLIVFILLLSLVLTGCFNKKETDKETLGEIATLDTKKEEEEKNKVNIDINSTPGNVYKEDKVTGTHASEENVDKLQGAEFGENATIYVISEKDATKLEKRSMSYIKGDYNGLMNSYHQIVSANDELALGVNFIGDGNKVLMLDFNNFTPMLYMVHNESFKKNYLDKYDVSNDIINGGMKQIMYGYYKTAKENIPGLEYVYFQQGGIAWEIEEDFVTGGLLFLEEGQKIPDTFPVELYKYRGDDIDEKTNKPKNLTGPLNRAPIKPINKETPKETSNETNKEVLIETNVEDNNEVEYEIIDKTNPKETITPDMLEKTGGGGTPVPPPANGKFYTEEEIKSWEE